MGCNRMVSRDWCGVMKDRIESQFDVPAAFFNGAGIGDVGPRTNRRVGNRLSAGQGDGVHAVREVGVRAATDAIQALLSIREWRSDLRLRVLVEEIFCLMLPSNHWRTPSATWSNGPQKDKWGSPMCEYRYNQAVIEAHGRPLLQGRKFMQTITAVGPLAMVPMPGEMFSGISLRIRDGSPFQHTLCCSVTNGSLSYLPAREARHRGGYETWVGRACGAYLLAETIDDALVAENLKLLRKI